MELTQLNSYLALLAGPVYTEEISINKHDITGLLKLKFHGDVGTKDKGEIEIEFIGVEALNIAFSILAPVQIAQINDAASLKLNSNYIDSDCNLYELTDDVGSKWWVYAKSFKANVLPVFYG